MPDLFNTERYAALHAHRFPGPALRLATKNSVFQAHPVGPGHYESPGRGPHGGFDVASHLEETEIEDFVATAEAKLHQAGAKTLTVIQPPLCHDRTLGLRVLTVLCRMGYIAIRQELNQFLPVDEREFVILGNPATRKRLRKAARLGVAVQRVGTAKLADIHRVLESNRQKKGRSLSMTADDLAQMAECLPEQVHLFAADLAGQLIAAAICIAVNPRILYVYAWGEAPGAEHVSPVTTLAAHIHRFAASACFTQVDIGTSSVNGITDPGLFAFKRSLGAESTPKVWLRKALAA